MLLTAPGPLSIGPCVYPCLPQSSAFLPYCVYMCDQLDDRMVWLACSIRKVLQQQPCNAALSSAET